MIRFLIGHAIILPLAILIIWSGSTHGSMMTLGNNMEVSVFAVSAFIAFAVQWVAFIPAYLNRTEKFYDLLGGSSYFVVVAFACWQSEAFDLRNVLLTLVVSIWALRLSSFLFVRIHKRGGDSRFDEIKLNPFRFLTLWSIQGLWILVTVGAALASITSTTTVPLGWIGSAGLILWVIGFAIEVVADRQKSEFREKPENQGRFIQSGLWAYSRHPNYLGEILLWIGVALLAFPALASWQYVTLISPIFVILLLVKISGIPLLEQKAEELWKDDDAYKAYKAATPVLLPRLSK